MVGELDHRAAPLLVTALQAVEGAEVAVDLSGLDYVDSVAMNILLRARERNPRLRYVNPSAWTQRLAALAGLSDRLFGSAFEAA